jgi:glycosyltransferase involved in cell wall biosynthesis
MTDPSPDVEIAEVTKRPLPSFEKKLNIYVLNGTLTILRPTRGDVINEILICKILSLFANVYYNNQLFRPQARNYGLTYDRVCLPTRKYDLYYVRNNYKVWKRLPSPKLTTALPYVMDVFKNGDGVVAFTKYWKNHLNKHSDDLVTYFYKKKYIKPKRALCFPQAYEPIFKPLQNHPRTRKIRAAWKADFVIVYLGRLAPTSFPFSLINIIPRLKARYKNKKRIKILFGGVKTMADPLPGIEWIGHIPHNMMPYYLSAADVYVCGYKHPACHFYGSRHTIECMATGLPIICANFAARREMLGGRYKLFWKYEKSNRRLGGKGEWQLFNKICQLIDKPALRQEIREHLLERAKLYNYKAISKRIREEIDNFLIDLNDKNA